ncbi:MAG: hypothetical protein R2798_02360 [Chitinophagales bacterium]|nr:hypothetical protein [Bacteroidota bacterium]MCB9042166.1 hypothetical protein [Chitinophagales bacterium]
MKHLKDSARDSLEYVSWYLVKIDTEIYNNSLPIYNGSSIGQHTRHILEFYICLLEQYPLGEINYDLRRRNTALENNPAVARDCLQHIGVGLENLPQEEVPLRLKATYNRELIATSLSREIWYNIEHTIHHLALIRIGLQYCLPQLIIPPTFGVAPSTIFHSQNTNAS